MFFMQRLSRFLVPGLLLVVTGCGSSADKDAAKSKSSETIKATDPAAKINAALAKLSPEDRALAEKQKICPVTDEPLGSMGVPYKVTVKDRVVFLCCDGCEEELKAAPDKFLAKLDAAK